jgi:hypothetical protein
MYQEVKKQCNSQMETKQLRERRKEKKQTSSSTVTQRALKELSKFSIGGVVQRKEEFIPPNGGNGVHIGLMGGTDGINHPEDHLKLGAKGHRINLWGPTDEKIKKNCEEAIDELKNYLGRPGAQECMGFLLGVCRKIKHSLRR